MCDSSTNCERKVSSKPWLGKYKFYFVTFILALLPKCPFCLLAYSSTIVLCSKTHVETYNSSFTAILTGIFCLIALSSILFNFKGQRTYYSLAFLGVGTLLVMYSVLVDGGQLLYYMGLVLMFFGIWVNGSFYWFARKVKNNKKINIPISVILQKNPNI